MKFVKLKDFKTFSQLGEAKAKTTAKLVVSEPGRWPWSAPVEKEYDVWSNCTNDTSFLRWRTSGEFIPKHLARACEMAQAFGEVLYEI